MFDNEGFYPSVKSYLPLFNVIHERKINEANLEYEINFGRCIASKNQSLLSKVHDDYMKKLKDIEDEYNRYNAAVQGLIMVQEFCDFLEIGKRMSMIKSYDKNHYNYIVDRAFACDTPVSLFKFKYASK